MNKLIVACFQICSSEDVKKNMDMINKMFSSLKKQVQLVCLPECSAIFTDSKKELNDYFDSWHINFINFIKTKAIENKTFVLLGSIPFRKKKL